MRRCHQLPSTHSLPSSGESFKQPLRGGLEMNFKPWPGFLASPVAWTKPVDRFGMFRLPDLTHRCSYCIIPPVPPAFLSHNPENAFPCFPEPAHCSWQDGQSTGRTMRCPLLRMCAGHPRAGKCLQRGFLSQLPPHLPFPLPTRSSAWSWWSDHHGNPLQVTKM